MQPEAQPGGPRLGELLAVGAGVDEHRRAGDDAVTVRGQDAGAHASGEAEVVGVDDERSHARRPSMTKRSTRSGWPARGNVASGSTVRR